ANHVQSVESSAGTRVDNAPGPPPDMFISFFGLLGVTGTLPQHYTKLVISRALEKDRTFRDFVDLYQHRLISLFYRDLDNTQFTEAYARRAIDPVREEEDPLTTALYSLVGMAPQSVRGSTRLDREVFLRFGGMFADRHRNAVSLELMLNDFLELPVEVRQFQG